VLAVAAFAVPAAQANAAPPKSPTLAQFNALKKQLVKDEKRIKDLENIANGIVELMVCQNALAADAFQSTWQVLDTNLTALGRPAAFGTQTPIADLNACQDFQIARSHNLPPTTAQFSAFVAIFQGPHFTALNLLLG
jgi:hypothetical protein